MLIMLMRYAWHIAIAALIFPSLASVAVGSTTTDTDSSWSVVRNGAEYDGILSQSGKTRMLTTCDGATFELRANEQPTKTAERCFCKPPCVVPHSRAVTSGRNTRPTQPPGKR